MLTGAGPRNDRRMDPGPLPRQSDQAFSGYRGVVAAWRLKKSWGGLRERTPPTLISQLMRQIAMLRGLEPRFRILLRKVRACSLGPKVIWALLDQSALWELNSFWWRFAEWRGVLEFLATFRLLEGLSVVLDVESV
jgi:hypothetical protein